MNRRYRLTKPDDFARVRRQGRSWAGPLLVLAAARNQGDQVRFGFSVGKRIGNAVTRNRTKRRLREAVWRQRDLIPSGYDLVFIARHPIGRVSFQQIEQAVHHLVFKAFDPATRSQRESCG